jgi:hypothetical protein
MARKCLKRFLAICCPSWSDFGLSWHQLANPPSQARPAEEDFPGGRAEPKQQPALGAVVTLVVPPAEVLTTSGIDELAEERRCRLDVHFFTGSAQPNPLSSSSLSGSPIWRFSSLLAPTCKRARNVTAQGPQVARAYSSAFCFGK